ncbi:MAG TPA: glycosyltransferase family 2 protein [Ancylobacter sp.]
MSAPTNPFVSVVLSFYNEESNIPELLSRLRAVFRTEMERGFVRGYELIFVNDSSKDGSEAMLKREIPAGDVRLINMSRNFGVSACVIAGFKHATGDLVVYLDSDLQDPPEVIHEMLEKWRSEPDIDVVNTVRRSRAGESRIKLFITSIGYNILSSTTNIDFLKNAGDFKLLSRRVVDEIAQLDDASPFIRGLVYWAGYNQATVHYDRHPRGAGESKFAVIGHKVIHNFLFSALISFSSAPLMLSVMVGMLTCVVSAGLLVYALIQYLLVDVTSGWTSLMVAVAFFAGIQLLATGINGLYLNSIFLETKRRPRYIVRNTFGFGDDRIVTDRYKPFADQLESSNAQPAVRPRASLNDLN